jgi:hypothetical protein
MALKDALNEARPRSMSDCEVGVRAGLEAGVDAGVDPDADADTELSPGAGVVGPAGGEG